MSRTFATVSISEKRRCDDEQSKYVRFSMNLVRGRSLSGRQERLFARCTKSSRPGRTRAERICDHRRRLPILLEGSGAVAALHEALDGLVASDVKDLARRAKRAREIVLGAEIPMT